GEIGLGADAGHEAHTGQAGAVPLARGDIPGHEGIAAGGDQFAIIVTGAGKDAGGACLDVVALKVVWRWGGGRGAAEEKNATQSDQAFWIHNLINDRRAELVEAISNPPGRIDNTIVRGRSDGA